MYCSSHPYMGALMHLQTYIIYYSIQCTVYSVQCTVYSAQCTVYSALYSTCTLFISHKSYTYARVQCTVYSVHRALIRRACRGACEHVNIDTRRT